MADRPGGYTLAPGPIWTDLASGWPLRFDTELTEPGHHYPDQRAKGAVFQTHARCWQCGQSVLCLTPDLDGQPYRWTHADLLAGVLAHIRRCHEDMVTQPGA